jgi:hypothetical protein
MSKDKTPQLPKVKWYNKAIVPWLIILFLATAVSFLMLGWFMAKADNNRVRSEASALIEPLVKDLKAEK